MREMGKSMPFHIPSPGQASGVMHPRTYSGTGGIYLDSRHEVRLKSTALDECSEVLQWKDPFLLLAVAPTVSELLYKRICLPN